MSFFIERSIYWKLDALIPALIFYFLIFCRIHWIGHHGKKKPKEGVSRNKCSHKHALCILKCLSLGEEKIPHLTCPSTAL